MKRILHTLFVAVLLVLSTPLWAQFTDGKVYRIVCAGTNSVSLGASALTDVAAVSTSETDKSQQWYVAVNDNNYTFRNLANGRYLQGNNGTSAAWGLTKESNNFTVTAVNDNYCIRQVGHTNGYAYMHKNGSNNIVSWETSAANSQWTPIEVSYTPEQLEENWNKVDALVVSDATVSAYNTALEAIFADKACTQLNSTYAAMSVDQIKADENYQALPAVLQAMVLKVKGGDWSEATVAPADRPNGNNNTNHSLWTVADTWDSDYAKKFRVQMYEPYSIEGEITSYLRINAHCNMDNPTGIYANGGEAIYIMVDGEIADGAELWVAHQAGLGATNIYNSSVYFRLKTGLNVIPYFNDASTLWINYVVHTYNAAGATIAEKFPENRKLSNYKPLKIHIEGGHINGFFNAMGDFRATTSEENLWGEVDNDEDWNYYKARVALPTDFALLGHRQTLLFPFGTYDSGKGDFGTPNADGGIEYALAYHLENINVVSTPNCYGGSGNGFGNYSDTYYPGMGLSTENGKINIMLEAWDRITYSELASMGLVSTSTMDKMNALYPRWTSEGTPAEIYNYGSATVNNDTKTYLEFCQGIDYSEYFNHHACGVGAGSGYMSGGWRVCNYHYNTMGSIIGAIANEAGPTWGPAHEIGHQHQSVFNLNGQTEVTNNFFSNVAVWYMGMGTSRVNGSEGSLESVLAAFNTEGNDLYTNNIWAITHLYYRLWLYYHLAGNNTQFWPRLFELCRQVPLVNGGQISGETSLLRFYQHACDAAGEDLTEFFRAHGFFEIMDNRLVGDYANATYNVTQEQIDAAIAAVKAKKYPVNYAALLINDATSETTKKHDGSTSRSLWDSNPTAEFGSVNGFIDGDIDALTNYTATVNADGTVTMSGGQGGAGFLILNEKGELVSFSNKSTFALSDEAKYQLATGGAKVVTVNSKSETVDAKIDLTPMQKSMLESFIADVEAMPIDETYTCIGFYKKAYVTDLQAALDEAKKILENGSGGYGAAYTLLHDELKKVEANNDAKVPFDPSLTYTLKNYNYPTRSLVVGGNNVVYGNTNVDLSSASAKWQFESTGTPGVYYVKNMTGVYCPEISPSTSMTVTDTPAANATYVLEDLGSGLWGISLTPSANNTSFHCAANDSYKVVGWGTGSAASRWYLTSTTSVSTGELEELKTSISKTEALVDVVANVAPCSLQTTDAAAPFYLWCNANVTSGGDASMPANGYTILDGNDQTFLHTVYNGNSQDGLHHYLRLDMGEGNSLSTVQFSYKTRHNGNSRSHPKVIKVEGSNDLDVFEEIATISEGLPNEYSAEYTSAELTNGNAYRYIRFMVTDTYGTATDGNNHEYFYIAEFGILSLGDLYIKMNQGYEYVGEDLVKAAYEALVVAKDAVENSSSVSDAKTALQRAYDALYEAYNSPADAKKAELQTLIDETTALIATAGSITNHKEEPVTLSTANVYCNATIAEGELDDIFDNENNTFIHTQWSGTSADNDYHYLRVDLGESVSVGEFYFTYTTASRANKDMPKTIVVEGANEIDTDNSTKDAFTEIATLTAANDGLPQETNKNSNYKSPVLGSALTPYRYLRFRVTEIARTSGDIADDNGYPYFTLAEFGLTKAAYTVVEVNDNYKYTLVTTELLAATNAKVVDAETLLNISSSAELIDAQIAKLQAAKTALEEAMAKVTVDKAALQELYDNALALYGEMVDGEGNVNDNYRPSALTNEKLAAAKTALDAAKDKLDSSNSQSEIDDAKTALLAQYDALLEIKNANVATTIDKSGLNTAIANANTLIAAIEAKGDGYYESVAGFGLAELSTALQNAETVVDRFYLTEEQYTEAFTLLNNCYTTTNGIVALDCNSENRNSLAALIGNVNALLSTIAVEGENTQALPLQATNENEAFYIWCNGPASDSNGVAGLIDKNADGTANTGTFLGTNWGADVPAYTHYIEIDLGVAGTIDQLTMDYTTRNSTHADQRPNAIKILGSNDKANYDEITEITSGLAANANEQWSTAESLDLCGHYRYIRVAVGSQRGFFHMADFNLYTKLSHTLKEYYTTAEGLDLTTLCLALDEAQDAAACYMTTEQYTAVYNKLNGCYTTANAIASNDYSDRDALATLKNDADALVDAVVAIDETETVLALQATDADAPYYIYCNAPGATNNYSGDNLGVAALLDVDDNGEPITSTFLHSSYVDGSHDDDLDHYLRVDMGDDIAVKAFKFRYTPRIGNTGNAPLVMLIEGSNDCVNFEEITTLTNMATTYQSGEITNGKAYRYIRFMVKDTHNHGAHNGHKFFAMSHFEMTACKTVTISDEYASPNLSVDVAAAAYNELVDAALFSAEHYLASETGVEIKDELQAAYNALQIEVFKAPLATLLLQAQELYGEMADENGAVNANYTPSALTNDMLAEAKTVLDAAKTVLDSSNSQSEIDDAKTELQAQYDALLAIENANVATTIDKSGLNTAIANAGDLITEINANLDYYATAAGLGFAELDYALQNAQAIVGRFYLTEAQYNTALTELNACISATQTVINAGCIDRTALATAIESANTLLEDISAKGVGYYSTVDNLGADALRAALQNAQAVVDKYHTTEVCASLLEQLNTCYNATSAVVNADYKGDRTALTTLIVSSTALIAEVANGESGNFNVKDEYASLTVELVNTLDDQKTVAEAAIAAYITEANYNAMLEELQAAYDALDVAKIRVPLLELIDATAELKNSLYEMAERYTATEITLQYETEGAAGYLYCNAVEKYSGWESDYLGVSALLDEDTSNHLHTMYSDYDSDDGLDHYLRVDLGSEGATAYVEFGYRRRVNNNDLLPKTVLVEACNSLENGGDWVEIATLANLPQNDNEIKTGSLGDGTAYRYWRFMVKETHGNNRKSKSHPYFALRDFNVYKCTDIVTGLQLKPEYTPDIYVYTTTALVGEVEDAIAAATEASETVNTAEECEAAVATLQAAKDKLAEAIKFSWCPVIITTDETAPALYTINAPGRSGENNEKAWQYNPQNNNITIVNKDATNLYHLWYFVEGTEEGTVKIVPVMTPSYKLTATEFGNAANKVSAVAGDGLCWSFDYVNNYYNFKPTEQNTYLSNYGGGNNPMGFYSTADDGSYVTFSEVELSDYDKVRLEKLCEGKTEVESGVVFGAYTKESADEYNGILDDAAEKLGAASSTRQEYYDAFVNLFNAGSILEINMPSADKFYALRCNHENRYIYVNDNYRLQWAASSYDKTQPNAVFVFDNIDPVAGTCTMKSYHAQEYLSGVDGSIWMFGETAKKVTIVKSSNAEGAIYFKIEGNGNNGLHAHGSNNTVISYTNDAGANHYFLEEVVKYDLTFNTAKGDDKRYSTLYLPHAVNLPEIEGNKVNAYTINAVNGNSLAMVPQTDETNRSLPAYTAVILSVTREDDLNNTASVKCSVFCDAAIEEEPADDNGDNLLQGTLEEEFIECADENEWVYTLGRKNDKVAMYKATKKYDADGSTGTTHVKLAANKAYLKLGGNSQGNISTFSFWFTEGATGIFGTADENPLEGTIYDLHGRKLSEINNPGYYIINGKKTYVSEVK